jgi:hypothetical protein
MYEHVRSKKHKRMMEAKSRAKGGYSGTLPEKPKINGDVVWEGDVEREDVCEEKEEDARKYIGTRVSWEGNLAYLKEVFEGEEDETVHEIGGRVQPKERGKVIWRDNVAYYEPGEGWDEGWEMSKLAPCPTLEGTDVMWEQKEDGGWLVKLGKIPHHEMRP